MFPRSPTIRPGTPRLPHQGHSRQPGVPDSLSDRSSRPARCVNVPINSLRGPWLIRRRGDDHRSRADAFPGFGCRRAGLSWRQVLRVCLPSSVLLEKQTAVRWRRLGKRVRHRLRTPERPCSPPSSARSGRRPRDSFVCRYVFTSCLVIVCSYMPIADAPYKVRCTRECVRKRTTWPHGGFRSRPGNKPEAVCHSPAMP